MQLEQKTHAVQLRKREEELAAREMNLLQREISVIIQVNKQLMKPLKCFFFNLETFMLRHAPCMVIYLLHGLLWKSWKTLFPINPTKKPFVF